MPKGLLLIPTLGLLIGSFELAAYADTLTRRGYRRLGRALGIACTIIGCGTPFGLLIVWSLL